MPRPRCARDCARLPSVASSARTQGPAQSLWRLLRRNKKGGEASFEELQDIINKLEDSNCTLEESFRLYSDGMKLLKDCNDAIDKVEKQVILLEEQ